MSSDRVSRAANAAEQLCGALWETLREQAQSGDARGVAALSRRLVEVCESFDAVASAGLGSPVKDADGLERSDERTRQSPASAAARAPRSPERPFVDFRDPGDAGGSQAGRGAPGGLRSVETGEPVPPSWGRAEEGVVQLDLVERGDRGFAEEPRPDSEPPDPKRWPSSVSAALVDEYESKTEQIEAKDVRATGHPPVTAALQRRLDRHELDGAPFSVLLIEVLDVERLRALRASGDLLREIWSVESAIAEQLRPADSLLREIDGRWWLIAPDTDASSARHLAERIAGAALRFAHHGAPLRVVVGIAVCPDHGVDAATLIGHADIDLYAAQAAGRSIGGFDEDPRSA